MKRQLRNWLKHLINCNLFKNKLNILFLYYGKLSNSCIALAFKDPEKLKILSLIKKVKDQTDILLTDSECYQLFMFVKSTQKIPGDIAEVGVYKGGSAKIICESRGNSDKEVHLFDTFEGLPEPTQKDDPRNSSYVDRFEKGQYHASIDMVRNMLNQYQNVRITKGYFPESGADIAEKRFSFVNLDVDLYESTKKSLEFFYPRMNKGGIIMTHDYANSVGVKNAFDEFFNNKPESIIELLDSQCVVVKL